MKKLKDIRQNLDQDVDVSSQYNLGDIRLSDIISQRNTQDLKRDLEDISFEGSHDIHLEKNKTKNFDSVNSKRPFMSRTVDITSTTILDTLFQVFSQRKILFYFPLYLIVFFSFLYLDFLLIEKKISSGYDNLTQISQEKDIHSIHKIVDDARFDFFLSDILFTPFKLFPSKDIDIGYHAIKGGKKLAQSLNILLETYDQTLHFLKEKKLEEIRFTQLLQNLQGSLLKVEDILTAATFHYESLPELGNKTLEKALNERLITLKYITSRISTVNKNYSSVLNILGHSGARKYLIVFQNNDEIRPTGGFMGSMALVTIFRGQVRDFIPRDVYSFEWDLKRADYIRVPAPEGINKLTSTFGLRDSNYYINLKDSSEAIKFFIEKSGQEIDGIIYINQGILLDFLDITGNINFEKVGKNISSENFSVLMSLLVEAKIFKEGTQGTPKSILFDFIDIFKDTVLEQQKYTQYLETLIQNIQNREIMFYSFHRDENMFLKELGFGADIDYEKSIDYAYPVFTSLSGNKSDRYMERSFEKTLNISSNCSISTTLSLISRHTFSNKEKDYINSLISEYNIDTPGIMSIQGNDDNYQFVRVILPKKAEITPQEGMKIKTYGERKGVEFYLRTEPTQTTRYSISYTLQNPDCETYTYTQFKQPGIRKYDIELISPEKQEVFSGLTSDFSYSKY